MLRVLEVDPLPQSQVFNKIYFKIALYLALAIFPDQVGLNEVPLDKALHCAQ